MKKILLLFISLFIFTAGIAQKTKHVKWATEYKSISATEGEIIIKADIEKGWHTYSQKTTEGPIPTSFSFHTSSEYELVGKPTESKSVEEYDKTFEAKLSVFHEKAEFRQKVKLKKNPLTIVFKVDYMCCNDAMCVLEGPVDLSVKAQ